MANTEETGPDGRPIERVDVPTTFDPLVLHESVRRMVQDAKDDQGGLSFVDPLMDPEED